MKTARILGVVAIVGPLLSRAAEIHADIPGVQWDELTKAVRAIESAGKVDEALAAYARGCTQNRKSVKLQDTFVRRMLKFGRPDLAYHAAKELSEIAPKNALAWGLLAYVHAKNGRYLAAFPLSLKAAALEPENPSICHNAAQLLAWYEGGNRKAVDADTSWRMRKFKSAASAPPAFAKAFKTARTSYAQLDKEIDAKKKEAEKASSEAKRLEQKYEQLRNSLRSKGKSFEAEERRIYNARRQIARAEVSMARARDHRSRLNYERQRENAIRQLRTAERSARRYLDEGKKIKKDMLAAEKEYKSKKEHANRLLRKAGQVRDGVPDSFGWLPPAVDGVVTPDAAVAKDKPAAKGPSKAVTTGSYLAPTKPKTTEPAAAPSLSEQLAEAEAADKLGLAKICMDSNDAKMKAAAKKHLNEILAKYPHTKAAAEARNLLEKLP